MYGNKREWASWKQPQSFISSGQTGVLVSVSAGIQYLDQQQPGAL